MSKGILVHAFNNESINYVKQPESLALRAREYLDLPVSIVTDTEVSDVFDKVIKVELDSFTQKVYNNGHTAQPLSFKNTARADSFTNSPYDETLILDTDIIICDDTFKHCFAQQNDLLLYKDAYDLAQTRDYKEFDTISETGVDFYWATCVYFRKTKANKVFFDLVKHVSDNWAHYRMAYQITQATFRNDFAFSIAVHIMNNHSEGDLVSPMPGKLYYTLDQDVVVDIQDNKITFLVDDGASKFTPLITTGMTIHAMNKFSLEELL